MMINGDAAIALNWSGTAMDIYWRVLIILSLLFQRKEQTFGLTAWLSRRQARIKPRQKCL